MQRRLLSKVKLYRASTAKKRVSSSQGDEARGLLDYCGCREAKGSNECHGQNERMRERSQRGEETTRVEKKKESLLSLRSNNEAKGDSIARVLALSHCSKP